MLVLAQNVMSLGQVAGSEMEIKNFEGMDDWQFHFVVHFDAATGKFHVDDDTTYALFHEGQIFMPSPQEWYNPDDTDDPRAFNLIGELESDLSKILDR